MTKGRRDDEGCRRGRSGGGKRAGSKARKEGKRSALFFYLFGVWGDEPVYMLSRNSPYGYKVVTQKGVPYFVKSSVKFEKEYPYGSLERRVLERRVEREYVGFLSQNCRVELQRMQWGLANKVPHCDMLEKFKGTTA